MTTATFDTLGYFEKLKDAGVPELQAKAQVEVIREVIEDRLATKQDILDLKRDLRELELATRKDIKELELRLTIRLGSMMAAGVALLAALIVLVK